MNPRTYFPAWKIRASSSTYVIFHHLVLRVFNRCTYPQTTQLLSGLVDESNMYVSLSQVILTASLFDLSVSTVSVRGVLLDVYAKASFSQNPWVRSRGWDALPLPSAARDPQDRVPDTTKNEPIAKNEVRARPLACRGVTGVLVEGCFVWALYLWSRLNTVSIIYSCSDTI